VTFPARAAEYGRVLAGLLEMGRKVDAPTLLEISYRRVAFRNRMQVLLGDVDLLLLPAMNEAAPTAASLAQRATDLDARYARIRFTAPLDMSGNPTLTLPGGYTKEGLPIGFQIVARHFDEASALRAGHAFQRATDWHQRRPEVLLK
jgi:amidase